MTEGSFVVYAATNNPGKLHELRAIFAGSALQVRPYDGYTAVREDATSYVGNAILKVRHLRTQLERDGHAPAAVLADDSGLEIDALAGRPGIFSARYAGESTPWPARRAHLLAELQGVPEEARAARFVCAMALIVPDRELLASIGVVEGRIVGEERGSCGFGYDPLFYYAPCAATFAQISAEKKNAVSHRRRAADMLLGAWRRNV